MTLLDQISDALGASGALGDLSSSLGASSADTDSLVSAGLPAILGGLGAQSAGDGMGALMGLLGDDGGDFAGSLGSFFAQGDKTGLASKLVGGLFGSQRSAIESHVASSSGGAISTVSRLLPMLAPAVMGFISKMVKDDGLDADGLGEQLAAAGASGPLADILGASTEEDQAGFIEGIAAVRDAGGLGALIPATIPKAAAATAAVAATGASAGAVTALASSADDDDRDRSGLGWTAVLLPIIALIAGLILWQCTSSDDGAHGAEDDHSAEVEVAAEPEPTPEPEPTAVPEPAAAPEPAATAEPEPAPEPTAVPAFTIADLAAGTPELSTLVGVATDLGLAEQLADADAGPFTVFAPTNDAFASAETLLGRLDDDQTMAAVTYHVVPGLVSAADLTPGATFDTVAGETLTVSNDGTLNGGVSVIAADLIADNGLVHIVDQVLVPGSISRSVTVQDLNALLELNPIQFALSSAQILPESQVILDEAIVTLTSLPAGTVYEVQGHTDSQGDDASNQILSEARATSVVSYLVDGGVDGDMLVPQGYGESNLKVDPEVTEEDFFANRRIEFNDIS